MDLPRKSLSPFEWDEYCFELLFDSLTRPHPVGSDPKGVCRHFGPLTIEEYRTDEEPVPGPREGAMRIVIWKRATRTDRPAGWRPVPFARRGLNIGYHVLQPNYYRRWSKTAQYYRRRWHRDFVPSVYEVVPLAIDEFAAAYAKSTVAREIPTLELSKLRERASRFPDRTFMIGARRVSDGKIVAGHAWFESPYGASQYSCGFYLAESRKDNPMYGLMDVWFDLSLKKGLRVLHLGTFQPPGGTWKRGWGISYFKGQFVTDYLLYQPPLWKIT